MQIPGPDLTPSPPSACPARAGFGPPIRQTQGRPTRFAWSLSKGEGKRILLPFSKSGGNIGIFWSAVVRLVRDLTPDTGGLGAWVLRLQTKNLGLGEPRRSPGARKRANLSSQWIAPCKARGSPAFIGVQFMYLPSVNDTLRQENREAILP